MPSIPSPFSQKMVLYNENRYQKRRSKQYQTQQKLLNEVRRQPDILPPIQSHRPLTYWQLYLGLSSIFLVSSVRAHHQTNQGMNVREEIHNRMVLSALLNRNNGTQSITALTNLSNSAIVPCHTQLDCFMDFLNDAGTSAQNRFAHFLYNEGILKQLNKNSTAQLIQIKTALKTQFPNTQILNGSVRSSSACLSEFFPEYYPRVKQLHQWMNESMVQQMIHRPLEALGAVLNHYDITLNEDFFVSFDSCSLDGHDLKHLDEAAQLYYIAQSNQGLNVTDSQFVNMPDHLNIRENFLEQLRQDNKREKLLAQIFSPEINGIQAQLFFDGIALHGAFGKNFDDLLKSPELDKIPEVSALSIEEKRAIFKEKFTRMGESTLYKIGTVEQSLATTIQRMQVYQHQPLSDGFTNNTILFTTFHQLESKWETKRDYPIHPRVLFAQHLVLSSNVEILTADWQEKLWEQECIPNLRQLVKQAMVINPQANRAVIWISEYFSYWNEPNRPWNTRDQTIQREAIASLLNRLQQIAQTYYLDIMPDALEKQFASEKYIENSVDGYKTRTEQFEIFKKKLSDELNRLRTIDSIGLSFPQQIRRTQIVNSIKEIGKELNQLIEEVNTGQLFSLPQGQPPRVIILLAKQINQKMPSGEFFVADDVRSRVMVLMKYASDRLTAVYGMPPVFNRNQVAYDILRQCGVDEDQIDTPRLYTITSDNPNLSRTQQGTLIDELLDRADWNSVSGKRMYVRTNDGRLQYIDAQSALQTAEEQWNKNLPSHLWIQARARENCRLSQTPLTQSMINQEAQRISQNFEAETESHRHLIQGLETWVNTIPVIGPIYNIEEGIRHRDIKQVIFGAVSLGLDGFDLFSGGGVRSTAARVGEELHVTIKVPHSEHLTIQNVHGIINELDVEHLSIGGLAQTDHIDVDPWRITSFDTNVPMEYRSLSERVRAGERSVTWTAPTGQTYPVVRLANEDRIIPVHHVGGYYQEVSWESGLVMRKAKLINYDVTSQKYTRSIGLNAGSRSDRNTLIAGEKLSKRYTVKTIHSWLKKAKNIGYRPHFLSDFKQRISIHAAKGMSDFNIPKFFTDVYQKSITFRRLANYFLDKTSSIWEIGIWDGWDDLEVLRHDSRVHMPSDGRIEQLRYLALSGWQPVTPKHIYLDAMISMITRERDFIEPLFNSRGPNIALRDRILFEIGENFPPQVIYPRVKVGEVVSVDVRPDMLENKMIAKMAMSLEDRYLDSFFDEKWVPTGDTYLLGTRLDERLTVKEIRVLREDMHQQTINSDFIVKEGSWKHIVNRNFDFSALDDVNTWKQFYDKSSTFRQCWNYAIEKGWLNGEGKWKFITDPEFVRTHLPVTRQFSSVDMMKKVVYLFPDDTWYLSNQGFVSMQFERKFLHSMMHILTRLENPTVNVWVNRGGIMHLTERILDEAGFKFPHRLAYGVVPGKDLHAGQFSNGIDPWVYEANANRARIVEEKYLRSSAFRRSHSIAESNKAVVIE